MKRAANILLLSLALLALVCVHLVVAQPPSTPLIRHDVFHTDGSSKVPTTVTSLPGTCVQDTVVLLEQTGVSETEFHVCDDRGGGTAWHLISGGGGGAAFPFVAGTRATAAEITDVAGTSKWLIYVDATDGPTIECEILGAPCPAKIKVPTDQTLCIHDDETASDMECFDPDGATLNDVYQYQNGFEPLLSRPVTFLKEGDCTFTQESIVAGGASDFWVLTQI